MKNRIFILTVISVALIIFGCGQDQLMSPLLTQSEEGIVLAKPTNTPFTATLNAPIIDPGQITVTGGVVHIRGQIQQGPLSGDIVGTGTFVGDGDVVLKTGKGPARADFTFQVTELFGQPVSGSFQGEFHGHLQGLAPIPVGGFIATGTLQGKGFGGLAGMTISGTFSDEADPVNNVFALEGTITSP